MIDYEILKVIWWLFIGVLLIGFAIMDGQDMGVGTLLPFLSKDDNERRVMINSVAPHWDGNQVWFITGGGAMFAAWPLMYATAFSGLYWALLLVLAALIFRPVAFDYRSKLENSQWRNTWDWLLFIGSVVPPIICGVAFGNLLLGLPFELDDTLRATYTGSFFELLNPFSLLCGVVSLMMIVFHGAIYLTIRTEGALQGRAKATAAVTGLLSALLFILGGIWCYFGVKGYVVTGGLDPAGVPNPLAKTVEMQDGAWFLNYAKWPILWLVPALGVIGALLAVMMVRSAKPGMAFIFSSVSLFGIILTPLVSMFPFIMPSSTKLNAGLTMWDCTSSQLTLEIMLVVTLIFLPLVLIYTGWAYRVMSGKLNAEYIEKNNHSLY